jgi:hypothetical protein
VVPLLQTRCYDSACCGSKVPGFFTVMFAGEIDARKVGGSAMVARSVCVCESQSRLH